jgi:heparan-alpha-glucosaminide N-acetyltransferase
MMVLYPVRWYTFLQHLIPHTKHNPMDPKKMADETNPLLEDGNPAFEHLPKPSVKEAAKRLKSLDVFRGFTIALMIFVDYGNEAYNHAVDHSPWNNVTLADFVMPFFLFIVGISMTLSFGKFMTTTDSIVKRDALKKAFIRSLKLFAFGLYQQGGETIFSFDLYRLRYCGILQRIAFAYFICAVIEIYVPTVKIKKEKPYSLFQIAYRDVYKWFAFLTFISIYLILMFGTPLAPPCEQGQLTAECNAAYYWDSKIMGDNHLFPDPEYQRSSFCSSCSPGNCDLSSRPDWCVRPFDPEGIVSSFAAIGSCFFGLFFGHILMEHKKNWKTLLNYWILTSLVLIPIGILFHFTFMPMNKQLYSISYLFVTGGTAGLFMSLCFFIIDVLPESLATRIFSPVKSLGMNAILIFSLATTEIIESIVRMVYWKDPDNNIFDWFRTSLLYDKLGVNAADIILTLIRVSTWIIVSVILDNRGIYWKI